MIHTTPFDGMTMTVDSFGTRCRYLWTSKEPEGFDPGIHLGPDAQGLYKLLVKVELVETEPIPGLSVEHLRF